jgi:hypothetical protein
VKFTPAVASVDTRVTGTSWDGGEHVGIYMLTGDYSLTAVNISEGASNREYETVSTGTAATFTPTGATIYYPANQGAQVVNVKFIAYYPYEAVADGTTTFTRAIDVEDQDDQSAIDFLYAPVGDEYDKTSNPVVLPFKHKLVKLVFNISNGDGVTEALTGLTVKITGQETTSALDLVTGDVPYSLGAAKTIEALTAGDGKSSEAIVLPLRNADGARFIFTNTAGETFTGTVPDLAWDGGKKYTYTVKLNKIAAEITGTIADWNDGNTGEPVDAN